MKGNHGRRVSHWDRIKSENWVSRFGRGGSAPLAGVFQSRSPSPSPARPAPPRRAPPLPGSDVTAGRVGRGGAGLWLALRGRKLRGSGSRRRGSGRCSGNRDAGVPAPRALSPEAVRGCGGDASRGGGSFGVWARRGVDRDARTGVGHGAPVGSAGPAPGPRPRRGASSMCQRRRGSGLPVPAGRRRESRTGLLPAQPARWPAAAPLPFSGCGLNLGDGLPPGPVRLSAPLPRSPAGPVRPHPALCTWGRGGIGDSLSVGKEGAGGVED